MRATEELVGGKERRSGNASVEELCPVETRKLGVLGCKVWLWARRSRYKPAEVLFNYKDYWQSSEKAVQVI